jgi:hypothetical protein
MLLGAAAITRLFSVLLIIMSLFKGVSNAIKESWGDIDSKAGETHNKDGKCDYCYHFLSLHAGLGNCDRVL